MAWSPISLIVPQYTINGASASGYVLKAYASGTSTNIPFSTSSSGATQATSIALNANGFPEVSGNTVIPHIDQTFKLSLYPTQAAADANSGATWTIDGLQPIENVAFGNSVNAQTATYTLLTSDKGKLIYYSGAGGVTVNAMAAATAGDGFSFLIENDTSGTVTFDPSGSEQVNGATTFVVNAGTAAMVVCNGTSWRALEWVSETGTQTLTNKLLTFPAVQNASSDANTLDDYEEGTWTPSLTFGGGSTGITYTTQSGNYVKIGKHVTAIYAITLSNKGSSTGTVLLNGLPFTVGSITGGGGALTFWSTMNASFVYIANRANSSGTVADIVGATAAAANLSSLTDTSFGNSSIIQGVITYISAS